MGREAYQEASLTSHGTAWSIEFSSEIEKWLATWTHDGIECKCDACEGIVHSLYVLFSRRWSARNITQIVGWLRFREPPWRKKAPSYYRRRASRMRGWTKRAFGRMLTAANLE